MKNLLLAIMTFTVGAMLSAVYGLSPVVGGSALVGANLLVPNKADVAYTPVGFSLSDINTLLGAYNRKYGKEIWSKMFREIEFEKYMANVPGVTDEYVTMSSSTQELLQPWQCDWTPKGELNVTPRINKVRQIKVDYELGCIDEIYRSFLGSMADEGKPRDKWAFARYIMGEFLKQMQEELDDNSFNGVYAAPTAGTAGASNTTVDGVGTIIANEITGGNLTPIATGALVANTMVDQLEAMMDAIPKPYRAKKMDIFMSCSNATKYMRDYRDNFGGNNDYSGAPMKVDGYKHEIIPITAMEGSDRIIVTPRGNMIKMYDKINVPNKLETQFDKRTLCVMTDFKRGYGFNRLDNLFVNDQA